MLRHAHFAKRLHRGLFRGLFVVAAVLSLSLGSLVGCERQRELQIPRASVAPDVRREMLDGFAARIKVGQAPDLRGRSKQFYLFGPDGRPAGINDAIWAVVVGQLEQEVEAFETVFRAGLNVPQLERIERRFDEVKGSVYLMEWTAGVTILADKIAVGVDQQSLIQTLRQRLAPLWLDAGAALGAIPKQQRVARALSDLQGLRGSALALEDLTLQFSARTGAAYVIDPHINQDARPIADRARVFDAIETAIRGAESAP